MLKNMTVYFHSNKESNYEQFSEFCENDKAKENCCYIGYELEIEGKFDTKTGKFFAHIINGNNITDPVEI